MAALVILREIDQFANRGLLPDTVRSCVIDRFAKQVSNLARDLVELLVVDGQH
jgi:hypothetical protein